MEHHTKTFGDLGVLKAQVDLHEKGYEVMIPLTEHAPFDLVAYKEGKFKRVQVKSRSLDRGALRIGFHGTWTNSKGTQSKKVDKNEIDVYCVYCPETNEVYYFNPKQFPGSVSLRVEKSKNNQTKNVKFVKDYKNMPS